MSFLYTVRRARRANISKLRYLRVPGIRALSTHDVHTQFATESYSHDRFARLSRFWVPTGGITETEHEDAHAKLIRAGYLRQSHAGIFHMLPLGQRVQEKLEKLIDKHMSHLGASKISLSSISSQALWKQTDRLEGYGLELFRFADRKDIPYLLAPTHEEEITTLVAKTVTSYKLLPLRLYQISRKYRDEIRPRQGLLRSREFLMKDLYTFDYSTETALSTYAQVRAAYSQLFDELKLPYIVAEASSGDIGGNLSHEYHLPNPIGEDNVISCNSCDYVANEELATTRSTPSEDISSTGNDNPDPNSGEIPAVQVWRGVSKDRKTLINVWYPDAFSGTDINAHAIKSVLPELDSGLENPTLFWTSAPDSVEPPTSKRHQQLVNVVDYRLGSSFADVLKDDATPLPLLPEDSRFSLDELTSTYVTSLPDGSLLNAIRVRDGDGCPRCESGKLKVQKAIELGHTFHLGTRYSDPLQAKVNAPAALVEGDATTKSPDATVLVPMQMGCHGIGVSRIIAAVADHLADEKGLNWPRAIAPFEIVVIPRGGLEDDAAIVSEHLASSQGHRPFDLVLDDRAKFLSAKINEASLVGYPVTVVLGRAWTANKLCEVHCKRLSSVSHVSLEDLPTYINQLLCQL
ncbi:prolyl-tRNA synthetase [Whalleya microplaca]|nr:prolyl-tRNA synthetase [Whalleya microplaca]